MKIIDLILTLLKRLGFKPAYCATDYSPFESEYRVVMPDGKIVVTEVD